jgi:hemerythrin-like domain-containing protein
MSDPIQVLMDEHRVIEKVLDALERAADLEVPSGFYDRALEFCSAFADACHHAKEEDRLFPLLEERGIPRERGPVGVMCEEHVQGRAYIQQMRDAAAAGDFNRVRRVSLMYVGLLRDHIAKEDNVLFAMARDVLGKGDLEKLAAEFTAAEKPEWSRYRAVADELAAAVEV